MCATHSTAAAPWLADGTLFLAPPRLAHRLTGLRLRTDPAGSHAAPVLACLIFPLTMQLGRAGLAVPRNWIDPAWALLALWCLGAILARGPGPEARRPAVPRSGVLFLVATTAVLALLRLCQPFLSADPSLIPWAMEAKPLSYLVVSALIGAAYPPRSLEPFILPGALLGGFLTLEGLVASLRAGALTRPFGSGEINYDAVLLCVCLIAALASPLPRRIALACILAGLAATLSRTGLLAGALILAVSGLRIRFKLAALAAAGAGIAASFAARGLSLTDLADFDRYWMWLAGLRLLAEHPLQALTGFSPGIPLPVRVPAEVSHLWTTQGLEWDMGGVFAYNFHAFWLRMALTWGVPLTGLIFLAILAYVRKVARPEALQFCFLLLVAGMTMGLFYLGNVSVILFLAISASCDTGLHIAVVSRSTRGGPEGCADSGQEAGRERHGMPDTAGGAATPARTT